jgi:tRNA uridine 5-carboxymethylaminomethyl modification enzyme
MRLEFDVVVVGGGHAGCEAALAAARLGCRTALVTPDRVSIGRMSCNPAIGGLAKGNLVREIDALGGEMGRAIDDTGIQFRLLNRSRGPAVRGPRAQADRKLYAARMRTAVEAQKGLEILEGLAGEVLAQRGHVIGLRLEDGCEVACRSLVVTTGTFLRGRMHVGKRRTEGGRVGEPAAVRLSRSLRGLGLRMDRLKTGTSPRIAAQTIDYKRLIAQMGDREPVPLSFLTESIQRPQIRCYLTRTNPAVHDLVRANLHHSPLHDGSIASPGPRYCPSLEDKVTRFAGRDAHPLILEPEGHDSEIVYLNGLSTSLPEPVQRELVRCIRGLEEAEILQPGYVVEYDFVDPRQLGADLQVRTVAGLFLAGQIDGTTGYEEAAGLGLLAGINAASAVGAGPPLTLQRSEAYLGVMVDDLVTRGTREPYRMFTSRAEFRLLLDMDSADRRLTPHGRRIGLVDDQRWQRFQDQRRRVDTALAWLRSRPLHPSHQMRQQVQDALGVRLGTQPITLDRALVKAPAGLAGVERLFPGEQPLADIQTAGLGYIECQIKYDGYLRRQESEVRRVARAEHRRIPDDFRYQGQPGLSAEVVEKLEEVRPRTLGQASRIPGLTPAAVALLEVLLQRGPARKGAHP